ncbi:MAG TPA: outer membrane beta-barrel protein [Phycisphaerae bacterium]|nr:outer membrane beta-barrel protein [Phycisphaerae bacterium]
MKKRQMEVSLAIAAFLAAVGMVRADNGTDATTSQASNQSGSNSAFLNALVQAQNTNNADLSDLSTVSLDVTSGPAPAPAPVQDTHPALMYGLDQVPDGNKSTVGQDLQNDGFNITGYVDVGYTANLSGRNTTLTGGAIPLRSFDSAYGNHVYLNQVELMFSRAINFTDPGFRSRGWDIGGAAEVIYGYDSDFIQSNGVNFYHAWTNNVVNATTTTLHPLYQFTLNQFYADVAFPIGDKGALQFQGGKFDTLLGYEVIQPTGNPFYSHSIIFNYSAPFTNTGFMAQYVPDATTNTWSFEGGVVWGWNQTFQHVNSGVDFMGQIAWTPTSEWKFVVNYIVGPAQGGSTGNGPFAPSYSDTAHYTSVADFLTYYTPSWNSNLTFGNETVWGYGYNGDGNNLGGGLANPIGTPGGAVNWFGSAFYQSYVINSYLTWNNREEYYYDGGGFSTAAPTHGQSVSYGELTTGLKITPFPTSNLGKNLYFRPELREDLADQGVLTNGKHYQTTVAMDVVYAF